jgi:hypothetical protein
MTPFNDVPIVNKIITFMNIMTNPYHFYDIMSYPIPEHPEAFAYKKKLTSTDTYTSRNHITPDTQDKLQHLKKYIPILQSFPFIHAMYLCDSITFNAANSNSDIDLFLIVEDNHIRRARLCSVILSIIHKAKRSKQEKKDKIDLIFYRTLAKSNIDNLRISYPDIYLCYWLSHLIPLYTKDKNYNIYTHNPRLKDILPNHPGKHYIDISAPTFTHTNKTAKLLEKLLSHPGAIIREYIIQALRKPLIRIKQKVRKENSTTILVNKDTLKFHTDRRQEYQERFFSK